MKARRTGRSSAIPTLSISGHGCTAKGYARCESGDCHQNLEVLMRWQDKLTKEERKHLREHNIFSVRKFSVLRKLQIHRMEESSGNYDIPAEIAHGCMDCRKIAEKLGF